MTSDITLWVWVVFALCWGVSILLFSKITAKSINNKIKESGNYSMSIDDRVGYSIFSIAIAVLLNPRMAQRFIPTDILDARTVKKYALYPRDAIFSFLLLLTTFNFFSFIFIDVIFLKI